MAKKTDESNGFPKRGSDIQEDFTPKRGGRTNKVLELWAPEIDSLIDEGLSGKVVPYEGVPQNVAQSLRNAFPGLECVMRDIDPDTKEGRMEIKVPYPA